MPRSHRLPRTAVIVAYTHAHTKPNIVRSSRVLFSHVSRLCLSVRECERCLPAPLPSSSFPALYYSRGTSLVVLAPFTQSLLHVCSLARPSCVAQLLETNSFLRFNKDTTFEEVAQDDPRLRLIPFIIPTSLTNEEGDEEEEEEEERKVYVTRGWKGEFGRSATRRLTERGWTRSTYIKKGAR